MILSESTAFYSTNCVVGTYHVSSERRLDRVSVQPPPPNTNVLSRVRLNAGGVFPLLLPTFEKVGGGAIIEKYSGAL